MLDGTDPPRCEPYRTCVSAVDCQKRHVALRRKGMATSHGGLLYYVVTVPKDSVHSSTNACVDGLPSGIISSANSPELSTDSGWDNPFRPDGDLSREADEIVELIKGGKPITPTPGSASKVPTVEENGIAPPQANAMSTTATQQSSSPVKGANGSTPVANNDKPPAPSSPGAVELQRGTVVPPSDASQVEHIVLKKKPKCKCCVIQ